MDLDAAIAFFGAYLEAEYAHALAVSHEPDDEVVDRLGAQAGSFLYQEPGAIMTIIPGRAPGLSAAEVAELAEDLHLARRVLFQVVEYRHRRWGQLFAGYFGGDSEFTMGAYGRLMYAALADGVPKIVAEYLPELLEPAPPVPWSRLQGADLDDPGKLVAARPLIPPTREVHRRDWTAIGDATR